jgi:hypothetical protein
MKAKAYVRTTVDIPTPLYKQLRQRAAKEGSTIKQLVVQGVEEVLNPKPAPPQRRRTGPIIPSKRPGSLHLTNDQIYEIIGFP